MGKFFDGRVNLVKMISSALRVEMSFRSVLEL